MFWKFVTSAPIVYSTHFSLAEVYEAEICRLWNENEFLKQQHNSLVTKVNEAMAQLHREQAGNESFNASQKAYFELSQTARNSKKRRIRNLVIHSVKGLEEFVPIEVY